MRRAPLYLKRLHNQTGVADYRAEMLDRAQVATLLPGIGPEVVGRQLLPARRPRELAAHASAPSTSGPAKRGVDYRPDHAVRDITRRERRLPAGDGQNGEVRAGKVVLAAGNANMRAGAAGRPRRADAAEPRPDRRHRARGAVSALSRHHGSPDRRGHRHDRRQPARTCIDDEVCTSADQLGDGRPRASACSRRWRASTSSACGRASAS